MNIIYGADAIERAGNAPVILWHSLKIGTEIDLIEVFLNDFSLKHFVG